MPKEGRSGVRFIVPSTQLSLRTVLNFVFSLPLPRGVRGRVRTATFVREPMLLDRSWAGIRGLILISNFSFDLKYSWVYRRDWRSIRELPGRISAGF